MGYFNSVTLIGIIIKDVIFTENNNTPIVKIKLQTADKTKNGDITIWHECIGFNHIALKACQFQINDWVEINGHIKYLKTIENNKIAEIIIHSIKRHENE